MVMRQLMRIVNRSMGTLLHVPENIRTTVSIPIQLARAAAEQAHREDVSRASVLSSWLQRGHDAAQADRLLTAYDEFYSEPDPDAMPAQVRRGRAANHDARWE